MRRTDDAPCLYMMGGLPGAGKTTFARYAAERLGAVHLNSVSTRRAMGLPLDPIGSANRSRDDPLVFKAMDEEAAAMLRAGRDVFYDSSHNLWWLREKGGDLARAVGATATLAWIDTPLAVAIERASRRPEGDMTANPPLAVVQNYPLEKPRPDEPHIIINGCLPVEVQFDFFSSVIE